MKSQVEITDELQNKFEMYLKTHCVVSNTIPNQFIRILKTHKGIINFNEINNDNYIELRNFYGSEKWFEYMEIEKIPVKCGVLTEDQLFDMISDHNELLGVLLDLTSKMYKNF